MSVGSFVVEAAIRVIEIDDVFVARMACGGHIRARDSKMENFKEGISGTASITKSTSARESIDVVGPRRDRILSDCSCVIRSFDTSFARSLSDWGPVRSDETKMPIRPLTCEFESFVN